MTHVTAVCLSLQVNGVPQRPLRGKSLIYSFNNANASDVRETQYFEMVRGSDSAGH